MAAPSGQITLTDINTYVKDYVNGASLARCGRAANLVLKQIHRRFSPVERDNIITTTPYSTGTVTVTAGQTSISGAGTVWLTGNTWKNAVIKISTDETWYTIASVGSTTQIILGSGYKGPSGSGLTYQICFPLITFPSNVEEVVRIWEANKIPLRFATDEYRSFVQTAYITSPGRPEWFVPTRINTDATPNDSLRYLLVPFPNTVYAYTYSYKRRPTYFDPTDGGTTSGLPSIFDDAIIYGVIWMIFDQDDKQDRSAYWKGLYEESLRSAMAHQSQNFDIVRDDPLGGDGGLWTYENRPFV